MNYIRETPSAPGYYWMKTVDDFTTIEKIVYVKKNPGGQRDEGGWWEYLDEGKAYVIRQNVAEWAKVPKPSLRLPL